MELLQSVVLTCCLILGTSTVPSGVADPLQLDSLYAEFPQKLQPYLTEEQTDFLQTSYVETEPIQEEIDNILYECGQKQIEQRKREIENKQQAIIQEIKETKAEIEEQKRIKAEKEKQAREAKFQKISDNISAALQQVGSPGVNLYAAYVSNVYQAAGYGYVSGNANDMYYNCCTSADTDELKNGMIIAVPTWNGDYMAYTYGHVGIYMDGKVWHNIGYIEVTSLESWIAQYGQIAEVRWGFPISV